MSNVKVSFVYTDSQNEEFESKSWQTFRTGNRNPLLLYQPKTLHSFKREDETKTPSKSRTLWFPKSAKQSGNDQSFAESGARRSGWFRDGQDVYSLKAAICRVLALLPDNDWSLSDRLRWLETTELIPPQSCSAAITLGLWRTHWLHYWPSCATVSQLC